MKIRIFIVLVLMVSFLLGCGVSNIVNRGEYIDHRSINVGAPRTDLLTRFGAPIDSRKDQSGTTIDVFRVPQGETTTGKVLKGGGLLVLDVFTLGLSEAVATPVTDAKNYISFEVKYDKNDRVREIKFLDQK